MRTLLREKAIRLRIDEKLSYSEIRKRLNVSKSTLGYWLKELPLSERRILDLRRRGWKRGEAARERFRNTMRLKREEKFQKIYDEQKSIIGAIEGDKNSFYVAGLMLYLGEGNKKDNYSISISNTDPRLIQFFIRWLFKCLGIPSESLKAQLHLYEDMDIEKEQQFWQNALSLKRSQFYKIQIRNLRKGSSSYRESFRHGTCQIRFNSGEKKIGLMAGIKALIDFYLTKER